MIVETECDVNVNVKLIFLQIEKRHSCHRTTLLGRKI